jgi:hypothetical protein
VIPIRELRHIIESSFTPLSCTCEVNPGGTLNIEVSNPENGQVDLLVVGVPIHDLVSVRDINDLIASLRVELEGNQAWFGRNPHHAALSKTRKQ